MKECGNISPAEPLGDLFPLRGATQDSTSDSQWNIQSTVRGFHQETSSANSGPSRKKILTSRTFNVVFLYRNATQERISKNDDQLSSSDDVRMNLFYIRIDNNLTTTSLSICQ